MPTLASILLVLCAPPFVILLWYTNVALGGSLLSLWELCSREGLFTTIYAVWRPVMFGTPEAWSILGAFGGLQLLLMRVVPGRSFHGPVTPRGNIPVYRANGLSAFAITLALYWFGALYLRLFPPGIVYDHFGGILGALNLSALILCLMLYVKGRVAPSSSDTEHSGSPGFDFYRGTELYPRILGWDVKQFTNCRIGMMGWALIIISFAAKQRELHGLSDSMLVAVALQLIYITKFFWWETGYLRTLDIVHDRAGFYICWGCLVWLPGVYTSATLYLVNHPRHLGITTGHHHLHPGRDVRDDDLPCRSAAAARARHERPLQGMGHAATDHPCALLHRNPQSGPESPARFRLLGDQPTFPLPDGDPGRLLLERTGAVRTFYALCLRDFPGGFACASCHSR